MIDLSRRRPGTGGFKHLLLTLALAACPAAASEGAAEYRHHVMEAVGGHMQSAADILRQKVPHQAHLALHANALGELSTIADTLFPEGSQGGDALPAIWENPDDFAGKLADFGEAAAGFQSAVANGGDIGPAFQKLGQACKSCHDDYREE